MKQTNEVALQETDFIAEVKQLITESRNKTYAAVNTVMTQTYWNIGRRIVEQEQKGRERADYGSYLIKKLSAALTDDFGSGLSVANLKNFRQFYLTFPENSKSYTLCSFLSWSHIRLIMRLDDKNEREYYLKEAHEQNWSVRELERNIKTCSYRRIVSTQKTTIKKIDTRCKQITSDFVKDPYVLEFLGLRENGTFLESELESAIITHLQKFLLEMGKGFSFVGRQVRISTETSHFYIDLVFYNYLLKCFVLIDLKTQKLTHQDIGQMEMYVRMFDDLKRGEDDNPTIGIIFCTDKDETVVKYSVLNESKQLFASKYKTILPSEKELADELDRQRLISGDKR
jgi:predicted nuclease of restriction endonuclease-like (RecB) superfamily